MRVCQFCGAAVEYVEPVAQESPQAESPSHEVAPDRLASVPLSNAAATPPAKDNHSSKNKRKKGPVFFAVQIGVALVVLMFLYFMVSHLTAFFPGAGFQINPSAGGTAQSTDSSSASPVSESQLGVKIYPGARALPDAGGPNSSDGLSVSAAFVTSDSMDKVIEFYKEQMIGQTAIYASGDGVVVSISPNAQESILVSIAPAQTGGKTRISISKTTTRS